MFHLLKIKKNQRFYYSNMFQYYSHFLHENQVLHLIFKQGATTTSWPVLMVICSFLLLIFVLSMMKIKQNGSSTTVDRHGGATAIYHWPFLGHIPSFLWNSDRIPDWFTQIFSSFHGKSGSFFIEGPMFSNFKYLVTCDPRNLEYILKTNFNNYTKGQDFRQVFDILGDAMFSVDSDSWRVQRKMAHANFSSAEFRAIVAKTSRKVVEEQLIPVLAHVAEQGSVVDFQDVCSRFAFESNMITMFGRSEGYLSVDFPNNELAEANDVAQETVLYRVLMPILLWKLLRWLGVGTERKLAKAHKTVDAHIQWRISQKKEELLQGIESFDLLSSYIKSPEEFTNDYKFLRDSMVTFAAAGKDTISSSLVWFIWLVSKTPRVEMKILEELKRLIDENTKHVDEENNKWPWVFDSDDLKGLVYLHAAICESLRLCTPLPLNIKSIEKEDMLPDGTKVNPGMKVILAFYSVGRMPWIWGEDCLEFKPERWIDADNGKISHEPMSKFFSFNVGPRTCVGKDISFTQLKSAIAAVLYNFHVQVLEGQRVFPKPSINLHMMNGLKVHIKKRLRV